MINKNPTLIYAKTRLGQSLKNTFDKSCISYTTGNHFLLSVSWYLITIQGWLSSIASFIGTFLAMKFVARVDGIASIFLTFDTSSFLVFHHLLPFQAKLIRCKDRSLSVCRPRNHPWFRPSGRTHPCRKIHSFAIQAFLRNWIKENRTI